MGKVKPLYILLATVTSLLLYSTGVDRAIDKQTGLIEKLKRERTEIVDNNFHQTGVDSSRIVRVRTLDNSIDSLKNSFGRVWYSWAEPYID